MTCVLSHDLRYWLGCKRQRIKNQSIYRQTSGTKIQRRVLFWDVQSKEFNLRKKEKEKEKGSLGIANAGEAGQHGLSLKPFNELLLTYFQNIFLFLILRASNRTRAVCKPFSVVLTVYNIWLLALYGLILFSAKLLLNSTDRFAHFYFAAVEEAVGELLQPTTQIYTLTVIKSLIICSDDNRQSNFNGQPNYNRQSKFNGQPSR